MSDYRIKHGRRTNFTTFSNEIFDAEIPMDTGFLYMFLLSLPDDWHLNMKHIQNKFGVGQHKAYRMLNELIGIGLIERIEQRDDMGKFLSRSYIVHGCLPDPVNQGADNPHLENRDMGKQDVGNQNPYKETILPRTYSYKNTNSICSSKNSSSKSARGSKLSEDWRPTERDIAFAKDKGWTNARIENEAANFVEHFTNGNGRKYTRVDWSKSWQTWVRKDYGGNKQPEIWDGMRPRNNATAWEEQERLHRSLANK